MRYTSDTLSFLGSSTSILCPSFTFAWRVHENDSITDWYSTFYVPHAFIGTNGVDMRHHPIIELSLSIGIRQIFSVGAFSWV